MDGKDLIFDKQHKKRVESLVASIRQLYDKATARFLALAQKVGYEGDVIFSFSDFKDIAKEADDIVRKLSLGMQHVVMRGTDSEWNKGSVSANSTVGRVLQAIGLKEGSLSENAKKIYFDNNQGALKAFQARKISNGETLSKRIWDIANQHKLENELAYSIAHGESADNIAKEIKKLLNEPDRLYRRVRDEFGELQLSKHAKQYNPGCGVYRSSYKNAMRLARTEINMAYRNAEIESYQDKDYVVGYEVHRSTHDYDCDVCESLKGKYPKEFQFNGWHPNCYSDDSRVLTESGWKLFKDVGYEDRILSLNPEDKSPEYVGISDKQAYEYNGKLIRFSNKSLDILVTPEHRMVYLNKTSGVINYCTAEDYRSTKGGTYRSSVYEGEEVLSINVGKYEYSFDDFAEFFGYWLADGSCIDKSGITISQKIGEPAREAIVEVVKRLGYEPTEYDDSVRFYDSKLNRYLRRFGKCDEKYIPSEIRNASKRQIQLFLDAFIKCDGNVRAPRKAFVGSSGHLCQPTSVEKLYFTTSPRLAGDLCELIVKVGHRPTVKPKTPGDAIKKDGSIIHGRRICYVIRECLSITANQFNKEYVDYSGYVYDLTLKKNHIMLIERNGFAFWGSNCRCYITPILITDEEMAERRKAIISGAEFDASNSVNAVNDVPDNFKEWIEDNRDRIEAAEERGTLPYFLRDNKEYVDSILETKEETIEEKALRLANEDYKLIDTELRQQALAYDMDITQEEKELIYDKDWGRKGYIGTGHSWTINRALRNDGLSPDGSDMPDYDKETVRNLDNVISRNSAKENIMLYRMQSGDWAKNVLGEDYAYSIKTWFNENSDVIDSDLSKLRLTTLQDKGFSSSSLNLERNVFKDSDHPICLELKAPKGTNMYVTSNYRESEAILGRGQKMVVVGTRLGEIDDCWGDKQRCLYIECVLV